MADVPAGVGAPTQYGPGVRALASYLLAGQYLPLARTAELLTELVGAPISQGSLASWHTDAAAGLAPFVEAVTAGLQRSPPCACSTSTPPGSPRSPLPLANQLLSSYRWATSAVGQLSSLRPDPVAASSSR